MLFDRRAGGGTDRDPLPSDLVRAACGERFAAVQLLIKHILVPVGGPIPLEWRTDWEELDT